MLGAALLATPQGQKMAKGALGKLGDIFGAKEGVMAENVFSPLQGDSTNAVRGFLNRDAQAGGNEVMADPRLAAMFGDNWKNALGESQDLASRGYSLQPEDHEAYGQASGNIARQFGQQQAGLQQALASRGLSRSGSAVSAIAGSQGNKAEQLARLQTDIAQKRMQSNMNRLQQTRNYLTQLTGQYQEATGAKDRLAEGKGQLGMQSLGNQQNQINEQFQQKQATQSGGLLGALRGGVLGLVNAAPGMAAQAGMGAATGGASMGAGGGMGQQQQQRRQY